MRLESRVPEFGMIFEAMPGLAAVVLPDPPLFTVVAASDAFLKASGKSRKNLIGSGFFEVFEAGADTARAVTLRNLRSSFDHVLTALQPDEMSLQRYSASLDSQESTEHYWSATNSPVLDNSGRIRYIIHSAEDVTELVHLTESGPLDGRLSAPGLQGLGAAELFPDRGELAQVRRPAVERQLLGALADHSPEAIAVAGLTGTVVYANASTLSLLGARDLNEALQFTIPEYFAAAEQTTVRDVVLPVACSHGRWQGELHLQHLRTQELIPVFCEVFCVRDPLTQQPAHLALMARDLREPKRVEQELRESEERFRMAFAEAPVGMVISTPSGEILDANKAFTGMLGYSAEELASRNSAHYTHPDDVAATQAFVASLPGASPRPGGLEKRYLRRSGEVLWARVSSTLRRDGAGRSTQIVSIVEDITERKRAEAALAESEARFRLMADSAPVLIWLADTSMQCVWFNRGWTEFTGRTVEQECVHSWIERVHHEDFKPSVKIYEEAFGRREKFQMDYRLRRHDGEWRWVIDHGTPLYNADGTFSGYIGSCIDITERKSLEQALQHSEERLHQVLTQAPVGVAVLRGGEMVFELANAQYQAFFPGRELTGHRLAEVIPEFNDDVLGPLRGVLTTGKPYPGTETHIALDRDGDGVLEDYCFTFACHPLQETSGAVSGIVVVAVDLTAQVVARRGLERANRELEEFAYVSSHDLQEPLRMVNIYTQLLLRRASGDDPDERMYAAYIAQGVKRMEELIRDLLSYSRTIHQDGLSASRADLSASLVQALEMLKSRIDESGARVIAGQLPAVRGDTTQIAHVFQNLLANSLKYRRANVEPEIRIAAERQGNSWIVSVRDNGIGFEQRYAERIFGLFKRLHSGSYPGTGLGLAICQRIVERCGGRMWAEGRPGDGSTFYFSLPSVQMGEETGVYKT